MKKSRILVCLLVASTFAGAACSSAKPPGVWVTQDTGTGDSFFTVNFVNENVGWLNGVSGRSFEMPGDNDNENKKPKPKPKKTAEKVEDPLKANQGFEVLQTND